jgi:hypothetical protein
VTCSRKGIAVRRKEFAFALHRLYWLRQWGHADDRLRLHAVNLACAEFSDLAVILEDNGGQRRASPNCPGPAWRSSNTAPLAPTSTDFSARGIPPSRRAKPDKTKALCLAWPTRLRISASCPRCFGGVKCIAPCWPVRAKATASPGITMVIGSCSGGAMITPSLLSGKPAQFSRPRASRES